MTDSINTDSNDWFSNENYIDLSYRYLEKANLLPLIYEKEKDILFYIQYIFLSIIVFLSLVLIIYFYHTMMNDDINITHDYY